MLPKVYLDNHTITAPTPSVVEAMLPYFREFLKRPKPERVLELLGAQDKDRFYFFSNRQEAITNLLLSHYFDSIKESGRNHILISSCEDAPIFSPLKRLNALGCSTKFLSVNAQGQITVEELEKAIGPRTSLVSVSWANGMTGVINPIADLAELCRSKGILFHVDVSHVIGKHYFRFQDAPIDYLTFEGSLIHAPKGCAGLLVREGISFSPLHENVAHAGLIQALEEAEQNFDHLCLETARLRDQFEKKIQSAIPGAVIHFKDTYRLPNCTAISFPGIAAEALLYMLYKKGVYATIGGGESQKLSHLLTSAGIDKVLAESALSFALSFETIEEQIESASETIIACVEKLQICSEKIEERSHV